MIQVRNLTKSFRGATVLDGLSLEIGDSDRIALIGSNGAGKTTLIRCLLGEYVYAGECLFDGVDARAARQRILPDLAFVPQLPPPLKMPVRELLRFTASACGTEERRIAQVARVLGLDLATIAERPFVKLSGGQKQKLLISLALGRDVRLLIMDEPAANLDPQARRAFLELLGRRGSGAMIISSHRLDEIAPLVNRVIELDGGRVVVDDRVPDSPDFASMLACHVALAADDAPLAGHLAEWGFTEVTGRGWQGVVPAAERWRFLASVSRHAGAVRAIEFSEEEEVRDAAS